jgi:hypothetical protein
MYQWRIENAWGVWMMVVQYIWVVFCQISSAVLLITDGYVEDDPLRSPNAQFSGFIPARALKTPSCLHRADTLPAHCERLSYSPHLSRDFLTGLRVRDKSCSSMYWISWRTFEALMENIFIYCCNSKRKCLQIHVYVILFSCFSTWNSSPKFVRTFHINPVMHNINKCLQCCISFGTSANIYRITCHNI